MIHAHAAANPNEEKNNKSTMRMRDFVVAQSLCISQLSIGKSDFAQRERERIERNVWILFLMLFDRETLCGAYSDLSHLYGLTIEVYAKVSAVAAVQHLIDSIHGSINLS